MSGQSKAQSAVQTLRQLPKTVWLLGAISLLNDSASELVYPLLPLYLSSVLLAGPRFLGLMEGVAESLTAILKLAAGALSDRFASRKLPAVLGYAIAAIARPLYALVSTAFGVFGLRVLDRLGKALRSAPRDALLSASVPASQRGLAFGLHRSMDHAGAVIGPLLAYGLISSGTDLKQVLLWAFVPGVLCVALAMQIKEPVFPASPPGAAARNHTNWRWRYLPAPFRRYLLALALFSLGNSSNMFLLLRAQELNFSVSQSLLCWAAMAAVATLLTTPFGALSDRIGRKPLLVAGWLSYALLYLSFAHAPSTIAPLLMMFCGMGLVSAATEGVEKALVADVLTPAEKGSAFGWFYLASGLPLLPASWLFGELWERVSPTAAFSASAACVVAAALLMAFWVRLADGVQASEAST
jgi:MFS family permease